MTITIDQLAKIHRRKDGARVDVERSLLSPQELKLFAFPDAQEGRSRALEHPSAKYAGVIRCRIPEPSERVLWASEDEFSLAVRNWRDGWDASMPDKDLFWHNPNENSHRKAGVVGGVPDWTLSVPKRQYGGMFIELKVGRNTLSSKQQSQLCKLSLRGYYCVAIWDSLEAVKDEVRRYLDGD
jgi:hypothetical protein